MSIKLYGKEDKPGKKIANLHEVKPKFVKRGWQKIQCLPFSTFDV